MIVLDASVVVEILTGGALASAIRSKMSWGSDSFIVPYLLDVEAINAFRELAAFQRVDTHRGKEFLAGLTNLPVERYPHEPLLDRIWELRHNFTAYDAAYIALAEATNSILYTCDRKLSKGHRAKVVVFTL